MTAKRQIRTITTVISLFFFAGGLVAQPTDRLIVVTLDGMRWQEIFGGADRILITGPDGGVADTSRTLERFWRAERADRRLALMPFLWKTVAARGLLLGDSTAGSVFRVTNGHRFSYPGYNELFTGAPDSRIDSNNKVPNPNVSVLEWLAERPGFRGGIEVFGSWDVFPFIFNTARSKLPVNADGLPFPSGKTSTEMIQNEMAGWLPELWKGARMDAMTMAGAITALRTRRPRVLVVLLGETDEWAHERRYDLYLDAARRSDRMIEELWTTAQSIPAYRGRTSLLIATDHGRGLDREWSDHGDEVPAAERIWMAAMGPRVGVDRSLRTQSGTQSQFAATIAKLLGEDWQSARPSAAPPITLRP